LGVFASLPQRMNFRVRPAGPLVPTSSDDLPVLDNDTAYTGIGISAVHAFFRQLQRHAHIPMIIGGTPLQ
jgi:hypothetical protein